MKRFVSTFIEEQCRKKTYFGSFEATVLFLDIAGFTPLTEQLMCSGKEGSEILCGILEDVFTPVIEIVQFYDGWVAAFPGDALILLFPDDGPDFLALQAAVAIKNVFLSQGERETISEEMRLSAKIGLSRGRIDYGIPGTANRRTFYYRGPGIEGCVQAEKRCRAMDIVIDETILTYYGSSSLSITPISHGFFLLDQKTTPECKISQTSTSNTLPDPKIRDIFVPELITSLNIKGEFRNIIPMFLSFQSTLSDLELSNLIEVVFEQLNHYGGYLEGTTFDDKGGSLLLIFGAPRTFENLEERALSCSLNLMKRFSDSIRIGLSYGAAYTGFKGGDLNLTYGVIGNTVNLAARIVYTSPWGHIRISDSLAKKAAHIAQVEPLGEFFLKGKSTTEKVYRLLGRRDGSYQQSTAKLIGRDSEWNKLEKACRKVFRGKLSSVVYLYGEAGIGKSRLLREVFDRFSNEATCMVFVTDEMVQKNFGPFITYFKEYFHLEEGETKKKQYDLFEQYFSFLITRLNAQPDHEDRRGLAAELQRTRSLLGALIGLTWPDSLYERLDASSRRENTLYAIRDFILAQAQIEPTIVMLEDLQWLDDSSKSVFDVLLRIPHSVPLILLVTARITKVGVRPVLSQGKGVITQVLDLHELSPTKGQILAKQILGTAAPEKLLTRILEKTGGNPFYIEQLCYYLLGSDRVSPDPMIDPLFQHDSLLIPDTLQELLLARIDRLSLHLQSTIRVASVLGREFEIRLLHNILIRLESSIEKNSLSIVKTDSLGWEIQKRVASDLREGEQQFIWSPLSEMTYLFRHVLLCDVVYDMQLRQMLRELHALAAEAYEHFSGENPAAMINIAYHFDKAAHKEKAPEYLEKAAVYAADNYFNETAIELYSRLLHYLFEPLQKIPIYRKLADIYETTGAYEQACNALKTGLSALEPDKLSVERGLTLHRLGQVYLKQGLFAKSELRFNEAVNLATVLNENSILAMAYCGLGNLRDKQSNPEEAVEYLEKARSISEKLGYEKILLNVYHHLGNVLSLRDGQEIGRKYFQDALKIAEKRKDLRNICVTLCAVGRTSLYMQDEKMALTYLKRALKTAQKIGLKNSMISALDLLGTTYYSMKNYSLALHHYSWALKVIEEVGLKGRSAPILNNIALAHYSRGHYEKGLDTLKRALETINVQHNLYGVAIIYGNMGQNYMKLKKFRQSVVYLNKAIRIGEKINNRYYLCSFFQFKALLRYEQNRFDEAAKCLRKALDLAHQVKRTEVISKTEILQAKMKSKRQPKEAIKDLKTLLLNAHEESEIAELELELFRITGDQERKEKAKKLYQKLTAKYEDIEYKEKLAFLRLG